MTLLKVIWEFIQVCVVALLLVGLLMSLASCSIVKGNPTEKDCEKAKVVLTEVKAHVYEACSAHAQTEQR